ncbi:MAG: class I SAM-dependent methyltransferase [Oscillospiraceae bacterium]|nr:class I SAM-dependent methyltransferase [Oscillospiraceae bacterium]
MSEQLIQLDGIDGGEGFSFGKTAEDYAKYRDIYPDSFYKTLLGYQIGTAGQTVLDLATGSGVLPRKMNPYGAKWTGADISEEQIKMAKELSKNLCIEYIVCPADVIPLPDNSFDAVTACQCFWYFPEKTALPEIRRVLKKGGRFAILFMMPLAAESDIVRKSEELVLKYNPSWSGAGYKRTKPAKRSWDGELFQSIELVDYTENLEFTRESWCGRMKSCRGIGASLTPELVDQYDREHFNALTEIAGETLSIPHQCIFEIYSAI